MKVESTKAEIKNVSPNIANAMLVAAVFTIQVWATFIKPTIIKWEIHFSTDF